MKIDGLQAVVDMLREMNGAEQEQLLALLAGRDPRLAELLRSKVIQFGDLQFLSPRELQRLLQRLEEGVLATALRGEDNLLEYVCQNLSGPRATSLRDLHSSPKRKSDVMDARKAILDVAKELDAQGKIQLGKKDKEKMVA